MATVSVILKLMALFQKNPHSTHEHYSLFDVGTNKTMLIVGLGNPGKKYEGTRHNVGFFCVDEFARGHEFGSWLEKKDLKCHITQKTLGETRVILAKPTTFMNLSGESVQKIINFYKLKNDQLAVIYDELDMDFGQIRTRVGGSDAGHNGVKSLISNVSADFGRVRVGIMGNKPAKMESSDYVLAKFSKEEQEKLPLLKREVVSLLTEYVFGGQLPHDTRNFL